MTGGALDAHVVVERRDGFRVDVTLAIEPGQTVAVMGPSGAGKSTLLSAIAGLEASTGGHVRIDGAELSGPRPVPANKRGVVLLGQDPHLFPHLSVRDNVAFGLRARGIDRTHARREADEWLARVGLDGRGDRMPRELSGGQQQRAALARALATSPRILLLDEPLTALDPETASDIRGVLHAQLAHSGATTLIVTHAAVDAASLATRLLVIESGTVTQEGPVRDAFAAPATRFVATLAGMNRVVGRALDGRWRAGDATEVELAATDAASIAAARTDGAPLAALFRPADVRVEPVRDALLPAGLPQAGRWAARVVRLEQTPSGARVHTTAPAVAVDVATDAVADQRLAPGTPVWVGVDAEAVRFVPCHESEIPQAR